MSQNQPASGPAPFNPQGPNAYGGLPTPPVPPLPQGNPVALAGLIVATVGTILSTMPVVFIFGWFLLPAAFVLALVGLALKNRPNKLAIVTLVLSIVGTLVAIGAFLATVSKAVDEATGVTTASAPATTTTTGSAPTTQATASDLGTRENPYPMGTTITGREFTVTINSFTPDATAQVLAANPLNDSPDQGSTYALVNLTVTNNQDTAQSPIWVSVDYVTAAGNVISSTDKFAVAPDPIANNDLYKGASATGNVVLMIPTGDAGVLRVSPGMMADDVFYQLA